jgi:AdoMet-dependent rRNA methyltransferase SPB1
VSRWFSENKLFEGIEESSRKEASLGLPEMPKTDKQIRKEKRKAALERQERRALKKMKKEEKEYEMEFGTEFDIKRTNDEEKEDEEEEEEEEEKDDVSNEKKELIRSGMGAVLRNASKQKDDGKFEVVESPNDIDEPGVIQEEEEESEEGKENGNILPRIDDRRYDSDHEDYDPEDRARTLALASMMLRPSKAKEIIDASYNRYAWNDSESLPDWFLDDEEKHYRPQIPIPKQIMNQMRERFIEMASKPLKKVAEARARKKRQQFKKIKIAKKKATDIANLPDMSTREKLKAIEKAMKGAKMKKQSKVYVVSRRGGNTRAAIKGAKAKSGSSGKVKLVDPRMKSDKRNAEIKAKRNGGKKKRR